MQSVWFWRSWSGDYRLFWYVCAALFVLGISFLWYSYFKGPSRVIGWEKFYEQKTVETISHAFEVGTFEFSIPIESYLTYEYFRGGSIQPNARAFYLFIAGLVLCALIILTVITTVSRFWYFAGMGLFILFLVSLRLEVLKLFGQTGQIFPIAIIGVYILTSFYFSFIRTATPFIIRFLVFVAITVLIAIVISLFAGVYLPFLHLSVTGYTTGLILSVIFILMVAHEIPASFVFLAGQGTATGKSLNHFIIISVVYLVNLWLAYFNEAGIVEWSFLYINLYLLLSTSAILGIWGFKNREVLYETITPFYPFGGYFVLALATILLITTGFLIGNHNDPALKIIRDITIFSHIGYGIIFLLYVFSNFIVMLAQNMPVHKVLYQPNRMPYFTFRLGGFIATLAFVFYMNWKEYVYHSFSGFYNNLGDLYTLLEQPAFAEAYYLKGKSYGFQNNRSNYVLADIETKRNNLEKALNHYELANGKRPTAFSLINHANLYAFSGSHFEAIIKYNNALNIESSPYIRNNLGIAYAKIHKLDSALAMFELARKSNLTQGTAETNFLALIGQEYIPIKVDSVSKLFLQTPAVEGNALALATLQRQKISVEPYKLTDSELNLLTATRLNNYIVYALKELDTAFIEKAFRLVSDSINEPYSEALKATLAQAYYHQGNVSKAMAILAELGYLSQSMQGEYNYILGLWALEQGAPEVSVSHFNNAVATNYKEAQPYHAIALAESNNLQEASEASRQLRSHPDTTLREIGRQLLHALTMSPTALASANDLERYQFFRYRITSRDTLLFTRLLNQFSNNEYRALACYEMSKRQLTVGRLHEAKKYINLAKQQVANRQLQQKINDTDWLIRVVSEDFSLSAAGISTPAAKAERLLYEALLSEQQGDSLKAKQYFHMLGTYNPFFEEGVLAAARYFDRHPSDPLQIYNLLTDAIYLNKHSYRLLNAYAEEADRLGFDEYAAGARNRAKEILVQK